MDIRLEKGELLRLEGAQCGRYLRCRSGRLWLTSSGDGRDHLLGRGESMLLATQVGVLISATEETLLHLEQAPAAEVSGFFGRTQARSYAWSLCSALGRSR